MGHISGGLRNLVGEGSKDLLRKQHLDQGLHHGYMSDRTSVKGKPKLSQAKEVAFSVKEMLSRHQEAQH